MIRSLHRWPGLIALVLVTVLALSGAALSVFPAYERLTAPSAVAEQSVADLAARVAAAHPGLEEIRRSPSGQITAWWFKDGAPGSALIDPATGLDIGSADPNPVERWLTNLHRSLFLDDAGRLVAAAGAGAMLVLTLSGAALVARRTGGWRRWFSRLKGPKAGRLHVEIARVAVVGLALSAATALWMTASTFDLLPDSAPTASQPSSVSGLTDYPLGNMPALRSVSLDGFRKLSFPYESDAQDVFTLSTDAGIALIDQGTGETLSSAPLSTAQNISETIYLLHTGKGAATLGLILGIIALSVPVMGTTGVLIWIAARRGRPRFKQNAPAGHAETVVLVGSEGGSTWGFAVTLAKALAQGGHSVHIGPMTGFDPTRFASAKRFLFLAATFGNGDAPSSAKGFLDRLNALEKRSSAPFAVLGFGDRSFPAYCAFAQEVDLALRAKGWDALLPFETVDRQSSQDFARWGRALGDAMGLPLELNHQPLPPKTEKLELVSRRDYGAAVQAPTVILRFALPKRSLWARMTGQGFSRFQAGDLIGIVPQGSRLPRFYSLASGARDGFVEIVVRKHQGGLCSGQLLSLETGDTVEAFLRRNPNFHAGRERSPLLLIGAGTGVGPLAGLIRGNRHKRHMHLFFGMRHEDSDFLYGEELPRWIEEGKLANLTTATSRGTKPLYVQDALRAEAQTVINAINQGAKIMVCGGRGMAHGVSEALEDILAPIGLSTATLKAKGKYVEDVY